MQNKTIIMMAVLLVIFATMTMARDLQENSDDASLLDEPRFSLRQLLDLAAPDKRGSYQDYLLRLQRNRAGRN